MTNESNQFASPEQRWQALAGRDRSAMDALIYAVKSTGVYCRPLCGSRLPRRDNTEFFDTPAAAEAKGFRACKQCKPDQPLIRYTIDKTSLGLVLIAETKNGICSIEFGDSRKALVTELKQRFPEAKIPGTAGVSPALEERAGCPRSQILAIIEGKAEKGPIKLDRSGTSFQQSVWEALVDVPRGETRTYSEIATAVGRPEATRAVAQACAANRFAVVVPCHRVIRQDGSLSGYRWGAERKHALLAREGVAL